MGDTAVSMAVCSVSLSDVQNGQKWKVEEMIRPKIQSKKIYSREVVVAQSIEGSLPIPEVRGSNPVIGKNLYIY